MRVLLLWVVLQRHSQFCYSVHWEFFLLKFTDVKKKWPRQKSWHIFPCIQVKRISNISAFSSPTPSLAPSFLSFSLSPPTLPLSPSLPKSPEASLESKNKELMHLSLACVCFSSLYSTPFHVCLFWFGYLLLFLLTLFYCTHLFASCFKASVKLVGIQMRHSIGTLSELD